MFDYTAPQQLLKDKVIMVTGAGDGIGRAAAITYAQHGATVILLGKTLEKLEAVYDQIEALGAPQAAIIPLDLSTATEREYIELTDNIDSEFGRLDGLLHNASLLGMRTPIENYDPITWEKVMKVNAYAPFILTQNLLPLLRLSENGTIAFQMSSFKTSPSMLGSSSMATAFAVGLAFKSLVFTLS